MVSEIIENNSKGIEHYKNKMYKEAIIEFEKNQLYDPSKLIKNKREFNVFYLSMRNSAHCYFLLKNYNKALDLFLIAKSNINLEKEDYYTILQIFHILNIQNAVDLSIVLLEEYLSKYGPDYLFFGELSSLYYLNKNYAKSGRNLPLIPE